jgi:hypothetical protein
VGPNPTMTSIVLKLFSKKLAKYDFLNTISIQDW